VYSLKVQEFGCAIVTLALIIVPGIVCIKSRLRDDSEIEAADRKRGQKIVELLGDLSNAHVNKERVVSALLPLLQDRPIGFLPEVAAPGGWFADVAPILAALLRDPSSTPIVEWFFTCFSFTCGNQERVLMWLYEAMTRDRDRVRPETLVVLIDHIVPSGGQDGAEWLYRRALDELQIRPKDLAFRALVLHVGRLSYSFGRVDKRPTIYDEQAIANDIAVRVI
jgi:hypothetical protein